MNCSDVKNKLPEYLTDQFNSNEKLEISKHLSTCPHCMKALEELDEPIINKTDELKSLDAVKLLSKARKTLILKVAITTLLSIMIFISSFFVVIPGILKAIRYPNISDITRSLVDITQFTSPSQVGGYGNSLAPFGGYSFKISAYTNDIVGTKRKNSNSVDRNFNMLSGTFQSPAPHLSQFIHPNVVVPDEFLKERTSDMTKKILVKNGENTVATVNISLNSLLSLKELANSIKDLDIKVIWMAVECGSEGQQPKNMSSSQNQYIQWGIPGKLFNPQNLNTTTEFSYLNLSEYEKTMIEELKWLDKNKKYIAADKSLLKFQHLDNSVGNKAKYILDNGFKVYGLKLTGPSSELSKLDSRLSIRAEEVIDIDFYYWN
jgi:hypothetical protein